MATLLAKYGHGKSCCSRNYGIKVCYLLHLKVAFPVIKSLLLFILFYEYRVFLHPEGSNACNDHRSIWLSLNCCIMSNVMNTVYKDTRCTFCRGKGFIFRRCINRNGVTICHPTKCYKIPCNHCNAD